MKRIVLGSHVQLGEISPRAANCVEHLPLMLFKKRCARKFRTGDLRSLWKLFVGHVLQPKATERKRNALAYIMIVDTNQLKAAAAKVARYALWLVESGNNAECGIIGFFLAGQDFNMPTENGFSLCDKIGTILRFARGCGCQRMNRNRASLFGQNTEPFQSAQCYIDRFFIKLAGLGQSLAKTTEKLFIKKHRRRTNDAFINHDTNRVGPNVDDRDGLEAFQTALCDCWTHEVVFLSACARLRCAIRRGADDFSDFPRPDKLGFVMKYSCALKASSPASFSIRREVPSASS